MHRFKRSLAFLFYFTFWSMFLAVVIFGVMVFSNSFSEVFSYSFWASHPFPVPNSPQLGIMSWFFAPLLPLYCAVVTMVAYPNISDIWLTS